MSGRCRVLPGSQLIEFGADAAGFLPSRFGTRHIAELVIGGTRNEQAYFHYFADNWQPMTGADTLQHFVSGATAEIEMKPDVTTVGHYHADGAAEIEAWNETFRRTWVVKGDGKKVKSIY